MFKIDLYINKHKHAAHKTHYVSEKTKKEREMIGSHSQEKTV